MSPRISTVGPHLLQGRAGPRNDQPDRLAAEAPAALEEVVGLAELQVVEEDLVQLVVVVLPRVDDAVIHVVVERGQATRKAG